MKIFIYPLLIAVAPLFLAILLNLFKRKVAQNFPVLLILILVIASGIFCTFASMIVSANGMSESMTGSQQPKCVNGAVLFFPIGIVSTVIAVLSSRRKPLDIF